MMPYAARGPCQSTMVAIASRSGEVAHTMSYRRIAAQICAHARAEVMVHQ